MNRTFYIMVFKNIRLIIISSVVIISVMFLSQSCKKEINESDDNSTYFFKKYMDEGNGGFSFVDLLNDNEIIAAGGISGDSSLIIKKTDKFGHVLWEDHIEANKEFSAHGTKLKDGSYVINNFWSSQLIKVSPAGNTEFSYNFNNYTGSGVYSNIVEGDDGFLYCSHTNGPATGSPSVNEISVLDQKGNEVNLITIPDVMMRGKILTFNIYNVEAGEMWIAGNMYARQSWSWSDPWKFYIAKVYTSGGVQVEIFDEFDDTESDFLAGHVKTPDGGIVSVTSEGSVWFGAADRASFDMEVFKCDKDLNLVWRKRLDIGADRLNPARIRVTPDGGYLISGLCLLDDSPTYNGFLIKLNVSGNIEFKKIFQLGAGSSFFDAVQSVNGDFVIGGSSIGFGNSLELGDPIILRTNSQGEY
jgi:hypothetical protein